MPTPTQTLDEEPAAKRRRLPPAAREEEIVTAAVALFSEVGFDGSTRDVARRAGITQPLLYRYFPDKDSLIEAVYARVYLDRWNPEWDDALENRALSVKDRFQAFYEAYTETVFDPVWLRISGFAALRDARIHSWYNHVVEEMILKRLVRERRAELGQGDSFPVTRAELEAPWVLHGGLLQYGMRRYILGLAVDEDTAGVISKALDMYLCTTAPAALQGG